MVFRWSQLGFIENVQLLHYCSGCEIDRGCSKELDGGISTVSSVSETQGILLSIVGVGARPGNTTIDQAGDKIYNGRDAAANSYPWIVWLVSDTGTFRCGGSLVSDRYVLTAAHCVKFPVLFVVAGDHDRSNWDGNEQLATVARTIKHPEYSAQQRNFDIALLELSNPVDTSSDAVKPIQLLSDESYLQRVLKGKKVCRICGWGKDEFPSGWDFHDVLQEMKVVGVTDEDCVAMGYYRAPAVMCYKSKKRVASSCSGDSGSPIVCKRKGKWVQVGVHIYSHPRDGCYGGVKGATKLTSAISWIYENIS